MNDQQFVIKVNVETDDGSEIIATMKEFEQTLLVPIFPPLKRPSSRRFDEVYKVTPTASMKHLRPQQSSSKRSSPSKLEESLTISTKVSVVSDNQINQSTIGLLNQSSLGTPTPTPTNNYIVNNYLQTVRKQLNSPQRYEVEGQIIKSLISQNGKLLYMISMDWTTSYTDFLEGKSQQLPGPINNNSLFAEQQDLLFNNYRQNLQQDKDFVLLNLNTWSFIHSLYGGGPEIKYNEYLKELHGVDMLAFESESQNKFGNQSLSLSLSRLSSMQSSMKNESQMSIRIAFDNTSFELPPVGFFNDSNYCFMHAGLQGLLTVERLNCWMLSEGKRLMQKGGGKYQWLYAYLELVLAVSTMKPGSFLKIQGLKNLLRKHFDPKEQHDCQEFIRFLLERLHDEMKKEDQYYQPITDILFQGQMLSQLTCQQCQNISSRFEEFLDLSLSMHNISTLHDCLTEFFAKESIKDNYLCDTCNRHTTAIKRFVVGSAPSILMMHIKRFMMLPQRAKLHGHVSFPVELNMEEFCSSRYDSKYQLRSVVVHYGTPERGHYVTFSLKQKNWYYFDDHKIYQVNEKDVLQQQAYLLFYEKIEDIFIQE